MTFMGNLRPIPARTLVYFIGLYRTYVSPMRPPTCRFSPTCSEYAIEALQVHGMTKGSLLAVVRLLKCAPWHSGGWDPVPEPGRWRPTVTEPTETEEHHDLARVEEQRST
ncbi:membrane protein insertion efficiency factor YidD [Rhodococcus sp. IEGM 1330]|uniref:membrane protein insertion efficiency factor YidD n=1 Tax=Rhodococcus sp. IEGM 1330 TaxID=3082225 RepID=UPI002952969C|nr:membrane protein insertion efficiency factor YidD [Rhodococcus sp. IEGM 1330]MDV8021201.1 membrane protein insertion efficiency factor YidD [Rhodococcus sp. IEGM 1330]